MHSFSKQVLFVAFSFLSFFSCKNDPKTVADTPTVPERVRLEPVPTEGASTFTITEGIVTWAGSHTVAKDGHTGTINVTNGELLVNQGRLLSGKVTLDMNSISVTDIKDPGERRDLESHLKDSDFFEANKYPQAEFTFKEVLPGKAGNYNWVLSGSLTMKGKTAPVNIPVQLKIEGDVLNAESPAFPINRTTWGVNFHSGILGTAKDKMIDDTVPLTLKVTAKKKS